MGQYPPRSQAAASCTCTSRRTIRAKLSKRRWRMWFRTRSRRAAGDQDTGFGLSNAGQSQNSKLTVKVRVRNVPVRRCASGGSLKADLEREWRGSMPIRARTSDNGVHVHGNPDSLCATALPYVVGRLAVARRPPERRCRSGACGRGWERPPLWGCLDRHRGGLACARPCHPSPGGRSRVHQSLAGRRSGERLALGVYVFFAGSTMIRPRPRLTT